MLVSDFDYDLPPELIAQYPLPDRAAARMLVMDRRTGACGLRTFRDLPAFLRPGDCLVLNDTKVIPARLLGHRVPSGGQVELLLVEEAAPGQWNCLLHPGRRLHPGDRIRLEGVRQGPDTVTLRQRLPEGLFHVEFPTPDVLGLLEDAGTVPLPPYIERPAEAADRERYQTVYAAWPGAVAAPTAGLHFTPAIFAEVRAAGVEVARLTLHVGPGTFRPVKSATVEEHTMHEETYELTEEAAQTINAARRRGGRILAVGTTSVRVLETCADSATRTVRAGRGRTRIFLHPPMTPAVVDGLLTNFHLPRSTLLMLVATFTTLEKLKAAYALAVREQYRFFSYGDCMLLI
jgi:S-adenosylmethionine:tRNA ribosyltransferase-isomerase